IGINVEFGVRGEGQNVGVFGGASRMGWCLRGPEPVLGPERGRTVVVDDLGGEAGVAGDSATSLGVVGRSHADGVSLQAGAGGAVVDHDVPAREFVELTVVCIEASCPGSGELFNDRFERGGV